MFVGLHFNENGNIHKVCGDDKWKIVRNRLLDNIKTFKKENEIPDDVQPIGIEYWKQPKISIALFDKEQVKHYWSICQV